MASTRNKNCPSDYKLEQNINKNIGGYSINRNSTVAYENYLPGNGLLGGRNPRETICSNYCDIESELFGIGTTNLVNPKSSVTPDFTPIKSLNIIDKIKVIIPEPLVVEKGQRPYYLN